MKLENRLVNRQKWRVSQYLSLYCGKPFSGENIAKSLCELDAEEGKLPGYPALEMDMPVDYIILHAITKGRLQSLQKLFLKRLETEAVTLAIDSLRAEGYQPKGVINAAMVHGTDYQIRSLPRLGKGLVSTWDFKIAMLNAVHQPSENWSRYPDTEHTVVNMGMTFWGQLFSVFTSKFEGRSDTAIATMILNNWYDTGVTI